MNNIEPIMKVRNTDYLEWQTKIQQLKEENISLKSKLASIKTLDRQEVKKIIKDKIYGYSHSDIDVYLKGEESAVTAICNLAIK